MPDPTPAPAACRQDCQDETDCASAPICAAAEEACTPSLADMFRPVSLWDGGTIRDLATRK